MVIGVQCNVILNIEQLEEVDCFKYLGYLKTVGAHGGCERDVVHNE